jgi:hypothetical protein
MYYYIAPSAQLKRSVTNCALDTCWPNILRAAWQVSSGASNREMLPGIVPDISMIDVSSNSRDSGLLFLHILVLSFQLFAPLEIFSPVS